MLKSLFAAFFGVLCSASAAALPLVWRADWPDCKPVEKYVHRGTDVELQPTWYINGELATTSNWTFSVYVKTNNQATGEWFGPIAGTTFSHTNDVGAAMYQVMLRAQMPGGGVNYTAFARLRMLDSPGFTPGELPLPVSTIDFSQVIALNAPWATTNDLTSATNNVVKIDDVSSAAVAATNYTDAATTLNTRGLSGWTLTPSSIDGTPVGTPYWGNGSSLQPSSPDDPDATWIVDQGGGPGYAAGPYSATSLTWVYYHRIGDDYVEVSITATRAQIPGYQLGLQEDKPLASEAEAEALRAEIGGLAQNLATNYYTAAETDDAIDALAAYYITYTAAGAAFPTRAALLSATVVYSGGAARTPTRNDYAVVLADESHGGAEWRYIYTVAAGATSGQWDAQYPIETNDYDALANKPQINGSTLTGNKMAAQLGLASTADATLTERGFSEWVFPGFPEIEEYIERDLVPVEFSQGIELQYRVREKNGETGEWDDWYLLSASDNYAPLNATSFTWLMPMGGEEPDEFSGTRTALPGYVLGSQTTKPLASEAEAEDLRTTIAAAALAATNYTDAATNALPAWTKSATQPLPPDYANVSNKAHSALQSEVDPIWTAEKTSYATVSQLRYSFNAATVGTGTTPTVTNVLDRAINSATLGSTVTAATVTLPAATTGRSRDFYIDLTIEAADAPTLTFIDPATGTTANVAFGADSLADIAPGYNLVLWTELPNNRWLVSVKHEEAT